MLPTSAALYAAEPAPASPPPPPSSRRRGPIVCVTWLCVLLVGSRLFSGGHPPTSATVRTSSKLDLVFTLDVTGSMGSYIDSAKENIEKITSRLVSTSGQKYDLRFGLVAYRDHKPEDGTFVTKTFPFTSSVQAMRDALASLKAQGGGDTPEAVGSALEATLKHEWREDATKIVILIADAPPHGLTTHGHDGFPNGEPNGVDPFEVLGRMAQRGITVYSVVAGGEAQTIAFFAAAAKRTNGQAVDLSSSSAAQLADVVVGASVEEMDLEKMMPEVQKLTNEIRAEAAAKGAAEPTEVEMTKRVAAGLKAAGLKSRRTVIHAKVPEELARIASSAASLAEAKSFFRDERATKSFAAYSDSIHVHALRSHRRGRSRSAAAPVGAAAVAKAVEVTDEDDVTEEATSRAWRRGKEKHLY